MKSLSVISLIVSIIAIGIAIIRCEPITVNWMAILVGVFSMLVTVLIGWNIYSVIDLKKYKREYNKLSKIIEKETNYLHNKADYHYGLSMCYNSLALACSLSNRRNESSKFQMYQQAANGMKILSNLEEFKHCKSVVEIINDTEKATKEILLTTEEKIIVRDLLKEIPHINKIDGLFELIELNNGNK
jgi:hypothetical protein